MTGRPGTPRALGPASAPLPRHTAAHLRSLLLVGAAYYLGARLGLSLSLVQDNVTPLWPPTGIALAAFLILGRATWPAVAVAAFAVNLPIGAGVLPAAVTAVGNTLAPLMAAVLLLRVGFRRQLDRQRDALAIVFLGALASMLVSATIGAGTLAVSREIPISQLPTAWAVWWTDLSNARQVMESIAGAVPSEAALVVVDLSDTSYLDSAGIAMIFRLAERLGHRRQELRLVVPADSPVRGVIELTNVPGVVPVEEAILLAAEPG